MHQALVHRSDPQPAVAIPEQPLELELPPHARKRILLGFPVNELSDSDARMAINSTPLSLFNQSG